MSSEFRQTHTLRVPGRPPLAVMARALGATTTTSLHTERSFAMLERTPWWLDDKGRVWEAGTMRPDVTIEPHPRPAGTTGGAAARERDATRAARGRARWGFEGPEWVEGLLARLAPVLGVPPGKGGRSRSRVIAALAVQHAAALGWPLPDEAREFLSALPPPGRPSDEAAPRRRARRLA